MDGILSWKWLQTLSDTACHQAPNGMFQLSVHSLALSIQQGKKTKDFSPEKKKNNNNL